MFLSEVQHSNDSGQPWQNVVACRQCGARAESKRRNKMEAEEEGYREIPQSDAEDMHSEGKKKNQRKEVLCFEFAVIKK